MMNPQAKLLRHGDRVHEWLEGASSSPLLVEIAPTGYCNASCPWCDFKDRHSGEDIDRVIMLSTLKELVNVGVNAINWTGGGEPTLHPNFNEFVVEAHELGLEQGLFTNACLEIENSDIFEWIRISLTDGEFEPIKVPEGYFGVCVNIVPHTPQAKLIEWCTKARDMGARYFQVRPALEGHWRTQPVISPPDYLESYTTDTFEVLLTSYKFREATLPHGYDRCYGYNFCPSIDWRGRVGVCLYRMDEGEYILGDLNKESFMTIWYRRDSSGYPVNDKCQNCCKNHEINKILFGAKHVEHGNFL